MSKFKCEKYLSECKAACCGIVPIELETFEKNVEKVQQKIIHTSFVEGTDPNSGKKVKCILPITASIDCCFLTKEYKCAIYEERPLVCKQFGDTTIKELQCSYHQDFKGAIKEKESLKKTIKEIFGKGFNN